MLRKGDLTQGGITTTLLQFTLPMLAGSLLQQCYNIADTLIVGQCMQMRWQRSVPPIP